MTEEGIKLIAPTEDMRDAYMNLLADYESAGEEAVPWVLDRPSDDFVELVRWLRNQAMGIDLKEGWVASSTFWLVRGQERLLGVINLRHELTAGLMEFGGHIGYGVRPSDRGKGCATLMLKLTLDQARELGIDRTLITCDKDNIASARVIQKNGGVLDSESYCEQAGQITQRYWIEL